MSSLLHDLRKLDPESYQGYDRTILKYALSLLEIIANDRQTRMTFEEFEQLPGKLEYSGSRVIPGDWSFYQELNERLSASIRERIAARLQEFVRARGVGSVVMEGDAILVQGQPDSGLLVVLVEGSHERIKEHLSQGAHLWNLSFFDNAAWIYGNGKTRIPFQGGSLEDPAVLPGFKLALSEVLEEPVEEEER
jgi:hypothetical protein